MLAALSLSSVAKSTHIIGVSCMRSKPLKVQPCDEAHRCKQRVFTVSAVMCRRHALDVAALQPHREGSQALSAAGRGLTTRGSALSAVDTTSCPGSTCLPPAHTPA